MVPDGGRTRPTAGVDEPSRAGRFDGFRADRRAEHVPSGKHAKARANLAALALLDGLDRDGRRATEDERKVLAGWSGWGALPEMFEQPPRSEWEVLADELRGRLSDDAYRAARASTPNAHYTSTAVAAAMWDAVVDLGFTGGRVLEPGCGSGNFFGLAPSLPVDVIGVEADPTTARLAAALYPTAEIHARPLEKTVLDSASFDLVIGNVPFANVAPHDPVHNRAGWSLHNYFIARSVDLVRPGGVVAVITSRYTLDAVDTGHREAIYEQADLLGAVRLPSAAFGAVAGTNAITDILLLRRRAFDEPPLDNTWLTTAPLDTEDSDGEPVRVNRWLLADPGNRVCGRLTVGRGQYRDNDLVVTAPDDTPATLQRQLRRITQQHVHVGRGVASALAQREPVGVGLLRRDDIELADHTRRVEQLSDGSFVILRDGTFGRTTGNRVQSHKPPRTQRRELRELIHLRDAVLDLLDAESVNAPQADVDELRRTLNRRYDHYVQHHGPINRSKTTAGRRVDPSTGEPNIVRRFPAMGRFRKDPGWGLVSSLECFDDETGHATKARIFTDRVLRPREPITRVDSPTDALAVSLDQAGAVDLAAISGLLDTSVDDARARIEALVFEEPSSGRLIPSSEYLSGNVRSKLLGAEQAVIDDDHGDCYRRNVEALRAALPPELGPGEIDAALGAPWIASADIETFIREVLGASSVEVSHDPLIAAWSVGVPTWQRSTVEMTSTWGTARRSGAELVESALNQRPVTIFDTLPDGGRIVNETETMAARDKLDQLAERFGTWIWEDPERADRLCAIYNERFNSIVSRRYDGAHLQLPGLADWFRPHAHQRDAVWRIVSEGDVLLAHVVGAGKTATMVMSAMEMRRLGLVTKPCFVVPNHMLEQFTREFLQLYPRANVLAMNLGGTTPESRRQFVAQCATGDWDGVILTRESFRAIPVTNETEERFLRARLDELETAVNAAKGTRGTVKELEKALAREQARLEKLLNAPARDNGVTFEQTGVDYLYVDEAHGYKGKRVWSRIPDVTSTESQRATDLDMKLAWLRERHPSRVGTLATGTPIANAIAEMWVMQSYIQPAVLGHAGCDQFDAWAGTFASTVTSLELKPSGGGYQQKTRFARYRNVPELLRLFHANADVRTAADLELPVPEVRGGGDTVAVEASTELLTYVDTLVERAERVKQRAVDPTEDNMLKITGDGRKAALDLRLVDSPLLNGSRPAGKVAACAERVAAIWAANRDRLYPDEHGQPSPNRGALQLVFCDLGTPNDDHTWSVYTELRRQLTARGVPGDRVRFVHEARNDRQKAELFAACRDGRVAVIVGSSEKMGVGTNIQRRAIALHHLDCPWRPAELEQREGRILRQGNENPDIEIVRYVTEGSFDVFMWQTVTRKAKFISQVMSGDPASVAREIDDVGEQALTYAQVMAIATGNPLIMERASVEADLAKLRRLRAAHDAEQALLRRRIKGWKEDIPELEARIARLEAADARRQPTAGDRFAVLRDGDEAIANRTDWGEWLRQTIIDRATPYTTREQTIDAGLLGGLEICIRIPDQRVQHGGLIEIPSTGQRITLDRADAVEADPLGLTRKVEHIVDRIPGAIADARETVERTQHQLSTAAHRCGRPFDRSDEFDQLQRRLAEIETALAPPPEPVTDGPAMTNADIASRLRAGRTPHAVTL